MKHIITDSSIIMNVTVWLHTNAYALHIAETR